MIFFFKSLNIMIKWTRWRW